MQRDVIALLSRASSESTSSTPKIRRRCELTYGSCAMIRISNGAARFTTSRPMLPRPMTPSVLPRSSLPRNFFFSHLPDLVEALACGMERASAEHERDGVLGDRNRIAARRVHDEHAGCGGGGQVDVVHADAGAADDLQLRRLRQNVRVHLDRAAYDQCVARRQVLRVFLRIGDDNVPAGLGFQQFDAGWGEWFSDEYLHAQNWRLNGRWNFASP